MWCFCACGISGNKISGWIGEDLYMNRLVGYPEFHIVVKISVGFRIILKVETWGSESQVSINCAGIDVGNRLMDRGKRKALWTGPFQLFFWCRNTQAWTSFLLPLRSLLQPHFTTDNLDYSTQNHHHLVLWKPAATSAAHFTNLWSFWNQL